MPRKAPVSCRSLVSISKSSVSTSLPTQQAPHPLNRRPVAAESGGEHSGSPSLSLLSPDWGLLQKISQLFFGNEAGKNFRGPVELLLVAARTEVQYRCFLRWHGIEEKRARRVRRVQELCGIWPRAPMVLLPGWKEGFHTGWEALDMREYWWGRGGKTLELSEGCARGGEPLPVELRAWSAAYVTGFDPGVPGDDYACECTMWRRPDGRIEVLSLKRERIVPSQKNRAEGERSHLDTDGDGDCAGCVGGECKDGRRS